MIPSEASSSLSRALGSVLRKVSWKLREEKCQNDKYVAMGKKRWLRIHVQSYKDSKVDPITYMCMQIVFRFATKWKTNIHVNVNILNPLYKADYIVKQYDHLILLESCRIDFRRSLESGLRAFFATAELVAVKLRISL